MRVKTSITLSSETLRAIDAARDDRLNRSQLIEQAITYFLAERARAARDARDREILDRVADDLNEQVAEALHFQADL